MDAARQRHAGRRAKIAGEAGRVHPVRIAFQQIKKDIPPHGHAADNCPVYAEMIQQGGGVVVGGRHDERGRGCVEPVESLLEDHRSFPADRHDLGLEAVGLDPDTYDARLTLTIDGNVGNLARNRVYAWTPGTPAPPAQATIFRPAASITSPKRIAAVGSLPP